MKTTIQNLWDAAKEVLRRKFIVIQAYLRKPEQSQLNKLTLRLKQLGKEEEEEQENKQTNKKTQR